LQSRRALPIASEDISASSSSSFPRRPRPAPPPPLPLPLPLSMCMSATAPPFAPTLRYSPSRGSGGRISCCSSGPLPGKSASGMPTIRRWRCRLGSVLLGCCSRVACASLERCSLVCCLRVARVSLERHGRRGCRRQAEHTCKNRALQMSAGEIFPRVHDLCPSPDGASFMAACARYLKVRVYLKVTAARRHEGSTTTRIPVNNMYYCT